MANSLWLDWIFVMSKQTQSVDKCTNGETHILVHSILYTFVFGKMDFIFIFSFGGEEPTIKKICSHCKWLQCQHRSVWSQLFFVYCLCLVCVNYYMMTYRILTYRMMSELPRGFTLYVQYVREISSLRGSFMRLFGIFISWNELS